MIMGSISRQKESQSQTANTHPVQDYGKVKSGSGNHGPSKEEGKHQRPNATSPERDPQRQLVLSQMVLTSSPNRLKPFFKPFETVSWPVSSINECSGWCLGWCLNNGEKYSWAFVSNGMWTTLADTINVTRRKYLEPSGSLPTSGHQPLNQASSA